MHTDIKKIVWLERLIPEKMRPYLYLTRIDRPIGIWLLLLPGWWSIVMASGGIFNMNAHSWYLILLFGIGAIIMRSAGCTVNDIWDRKLDRQVARTKERPIASGAISTLQALIFLAILLIAGLLILLQMNRLTIILGIISLPLIAAYPLMKKITWWPQAFLGVTFNFGALMGWSAVTGSLALPAILLYIAGIFWTLGYDTIYAHQDKEDDALAGIKSTALLFGNISKERVKRFYEVTTVALAFSVLLATGSLLSTIAVMLACSHLLWQMTEWNPEEPMSSLEIFKSNRDFGLLVLLALCFG